jgi:hypothetical protein
MRAWLAGCLIVISLTVSIQKAMADVWRPAVRPSPAASAQLPPDSGNLATSNTPIVTLGRPEGMYRPAGGSQNQQPESSPEIIQTSFDAPARVLADPIIRAQAPDQASPTLAPPVGGFPATPEERYNTGVVINNGQPIAGNGGPGFWGQCQDFINNCGQAMTANNHALFQSDHCFDNFISPVTNPFFFEDPRSLTEVRPIFMYQSTPGSNYIFHGGDVEWFGTQARLALTDRLSFVISELGFIWLEPHNHIDGFQPHTGFSELHLGPKYTFIRSEDTGTLLAGGLTFAIPAGPGKVFQDTGTLSLVPYFSLGQNFWRTSFGSFNFLTTMGYSAGMDTRRTDYFFGSYHLDFDLFNAHKIYPLIELNWFHYGAAGNYRPITFEGRDLVNFGAHGVSGSDNLSMALGARYKFAEWAQTGIAAEFPINAPHMLQDFRLTIEFILRY